MRNLLARVLAAAIAAAVAPLAAAHEFTCSATTSILAVTPAGDLALNGDGLPVAIGSGNILPTLTVRSYPAVVGVQVALRNVASEPSTVTGLWDTLDSTGGAPAMRFGAPIGEGTTLPVGGTAVAWFAYRVDSQAACLHAFGGQVDGPVCTDATGFRFVATNDVGSTECRARIVCAAPPVAMGPPPPPPCPPTWHGVKQFGSEGRDGARGIALDPQCNVDVAGSKGVPGTPGNGFLARFMPDGTMNEMIDLYGVSQAVLASSVAVDLDGNRMIAWSEGTGTYVSKFVPSHSSAFTTVLGWNDVQKVAVDDVGNAYAVGSDLTRVAVVAKLDALDGHVVWSRRLAASDVSGGLGVALDSAGHVLVTGWAVGAMGGHPNAGGADAFVAKLDQDGNVLWATLVGTPEYENGTSVTADGAAGFVYVGGNTYGAFPGNTSAGSSDAFVAKLDPDGTLMWVRQLGSAGDDTTNGVAADFMGNVWAVGYDVAPLAGQAGHGGEDAFVARLDGEGNLVWVNEFGTAAADQAFDVALDAAGDAFVAGATQGDLGAGFGGWDAFVAKFDPLGNLQ